MRIALAGLVLFALLLAPPALWADEPPTPPAKAEPPVAPKPVDPVPAEGEGADEGASPAPATTPAEPVRPHAAWAKLQEDLSGLNRLQRTPALKQGAAAFLASWETGGRVPEGEDHLYLGFFLRTAGRSAQAQQAFATAGSLEGLAPELADQAAAGEASLLTSSEVRQALGKEALEAAVTRLQARAEAPLDAERRVQATGLRGTVAYLLEMGGRKGDSLALRMQTVLDDPGSTGRNYRSIVSLLMGSTHALDGYDAVRTAARAILPVLEHQQRLAVEQAEASLAEAKTKGDAGAVTRAERTVSGAQRLLERMGSADKPLGMLGAPAPTWTLEKAYGEVEQITDLRGKVVVLDFWATWCPWCIKSFPAIRDLLRDYTERGLVVVGVTASASAVYDQRYDLDDDLADKAEAGARPRPAARLASARAPADGETVFEADAFRAKEQEVLATFIANHQMTWPVVMIDKAEPSPKYALTGWPHAVVIDREGRIRYFKSGALLRDRPEAVAAFRKVLEDLLAEPAAQPAR